MKIITPQDVRPDVRAYLEGWFDKAQKRQEGKGKKFNLSFGDFLNLWGTRRLRTLGEWMDKGELYVRNRKATKDDPNPSGYVLSPISFAATQEMICTPENMQICTRGKALHDCAMKKGDKHSDLSRSRISQSTKGIAKSEEHRRKISKSMTGIKRGPMTEEQKAKRAASAKAYWDRKKAEQAQGNAA